MLRVAMILGILLLAGAAARSRAEAQGRPLWAVDPAGGTLHWGIPGGPASPPLVLGGAPWQVRADLHGSAVIPDALLPLVHLVGAGGLVTAGLPAPARDAVVDGHGGALVAVAVTGRGTTDVLAVDPSGAVRLALTRPGYFPRLRLLDDGTVLLAGWDPAGTAWIERCALHDGATVARRPLPALPRDVAGDDDGRLLLPGAWANGIPVLDRLLNVVDVLPAVFPVHRAIPFGGGGVLVVSGWPPVLTSLVTHPFPSQPFAWPGAGTVESLPDGSVLVHAPSTGLACRTRSAGGVFWFGPWPATLAAGDGAGLQHARTAELDADPDGDGFPTRLELHYGTDPGDPASQPLDLRLAGDHLDLAAPCCPGFWYVVQASASAAAGSTLPFPAADPLAVLSWRPGVLFHLPVGLLDPYGLAFVLVRSPVPPAVSVVVGAAVVDPLTFIPVLRAPARWLQP